MGLFSYFVGCLTCCRKTYAMASDDRVKGIHGNEARAREIRRQLTSYGANGVSQHIPGIEQEKSLYNGSMAYHASSPWNTSPPHG